MAAPKLVTTIIAWDIESFVSTAAEVREAHDISIDPSEGNGESKKSRGETHGVLVMLLVNSVFNLNSELETEFYLYLKRIYSCRLGSGRFFE